MKLAAVVPAWAVGEFLGTFILVFVGCGSVATAVVTGSRIDAFEVAVIWGIGVALAIHLTASLSGAHLNPAVTISFAVWRAFPKSKVVPYLVMQIAGAIVAAAVLFVVYSPSLSEFEAGHGIVRGQPGSEASAMIFGEYYPNPGGSPLPASLSPLSLEARSCFIEGIGTALLLLVICGLTDSNNGSRPHQLTPWAIGMTVTVLILLLGPLTMACFNPARDFGPRLFSSLAGWGALPFRVNGLGWLNVYILAPVAGGIAGTGLHHMVLRNLYGRANVAPSMPV